MFDELQNLNVENCSDSELKAWVKQTIPIVITFLKAGVRLTQSEEKQPEKIPCDNCDKVETCKEPCNLLEAMLPGAQSGSSLLSNTIGNTMDLLAKKGELKESGRNTPSLNTIDIPVPDALFNIYSHCHEIFTKSQWVVIYLKYKKGMQNKDIAKQLTITPSSVCDRLRRAKSSMEKHYAKQKTKKNTYKHE